MNNNLVSFEGNLTKDPEYRTVSEDKDLAVFRIAVNERLNREKEETLYIDVNAWGWHVPYCKNVNLSKGDRVILKGRLQERSWKDGQGNNRTSVVVVPNTFSKVVRPKKAAVTEAEPFQFYIKMKQDRIKSRISLIENELFLVGNALHEPQLNPHEHRELKRKSSKLQKEKKKLEKRLQTFKQY